MNFIHLLIQSIFIACLLCARNYYLYWGGSNGQIDKKHFFMELTF